MAKLEIEEENFMKTHREGCSDVKKVLENLKPELFAKKYPCLKRYTGAVSGARGVVILFTHKDAGYVVIPCPNHVMGQHSNCWGERDFTPIKGVAVSSKCEDTVARYRMQPQTAAARKESYELEILE